MTNHRYFLFLGMFISPLWAEVSFAKLMAPESEKLGNSVPSKTEVSPSAGAPAAEGAAHPAGKDSSFVLCKIGKEVRTLRVEKKSSICVATYTKAGVDKEVGRSSEFNTCLEVADKIRKTIEGGGWKCKDINQAKVSYSE